MASPRRWVTIRVPQECGDCGRDIKPGERSYSKWKPNASWPRARCEQCQELRDDETLRRMGYMPNDMEGTK